MKVSVRFDHGLGDSSNFAHMIPLFTRRGFEVEVACSHDKTPLFRAAGAIITDSSRSNHPWSHPPIQAFSRLNDPWNSNKAGYNLNQPPMPHIGRDCERWDEYVQVKLSLGDQLTPEHKSVIEGFTDNLPRPWILLHTKGNTSPESKNYDDQRTLELYKEISDRTEGTMILLDWDDRVSRLNSYRLRHLKDDWRTLSTMELYCLMTRADLFVGVDSGPLHFLRFTNTPGIGLWVRHYPSHFILPREQTLNIVPAFHAGGDKYRRHTFNTIVAPHNYLCPRFVATQVERMLGQPRYLTRERQARDVQLQHFVGLTRSSHSYNNGYLDRHRSFDLAMKHLATITDPVLVETGTIRSEEDWSGAGFSSYLFGAFLQKHGGTLHSVDLSEPYCQFARTWTAPFGCVQIHHAHSHDFLRNFTGKIDLFYSDSCDVGVEGYQDCCLGEVQLAQLHLHKKSLVLIDDTVYGGGRWHGKGSLAVPWLLENGWQIVYAGYQVLLEQKA